MATAPSANQFVFVQKESSPGTINNSAGTSTVANGDAMRIISCQMDPDRAMIQRPDKTSTLTAASGQAGRRQASMSMSFSCAGSGSAGTKPDCDEILEALFGKAAVVSGGVSVTYGLEDVMAATPAHLSVFSFRDPSTMIQQVGFGTVISSASMEFGSDVARMEVSGEPKWVMDTAQFGVAETEAKGGLTTMPARPASPTYQGNFAIGFTGSVSLDGNTYATLRSARVTLNMNRRRRQNIFGSFYPGPVYQTPREVLVEIELDDDDSVNLTQMKRNAVAKTPVTVILAAGATAGNIWTLTLAGVQFDSSRLVDGDQDWGVRFSGRAYGSTGKDEATLVLT